MTMVAFSNMMTFVKKSSCKVDFMWYTSLKDAIPREWRHVVKNSHSVNINVGDILSMTLKLYSGLKTLSSMKTRDVYWRFISRIVKEPTAIHKWQELYPGSSFDWKYIFMIPYFSVRDTKTQSLHFQIVHRFFPCNYTLNKWYAESEKNCLSCGEIDTLEHYFYKCDALKYFWSSFFKWWFHITKTQFEIHSLDIVLGIQNLTDCNLLNSLNYCILLAKVYIYDCKYNKRECVFYDYQKRLKSEIDSEFLLLTEKGMLDKFNALFKLIYENL